MMDRDGLVAMVIQGWMKTKGSELTGLLLPTSANE